MKLSNLAHVQALLAKQLPNHLRDKATWQYVSTLLDGAANGKTDPGEVLVALRTALRVESVEHRLR